MSPLVFVLVILLLFGGIGTGPWWGYSTGWGYGPSGFFGVLLVILLVMLLFGHLS